MEQKSHNLFPVKKPKKTTQVVIWILILIVFGWLVFFSPIFKSREIVIAGKNSEARKVIELGQLAAIIPQTIKNKERVNLLFLGIPGKGNSAPYLTDSIIIINSSPTGENPIGISIPRDLLVKFPNKNYYTKINSLYKWGGIEQGGIDLITKVINEITDLEIDYFIVLDLNGVKEVIDKVDGIDIIVENDIYDPYFPGPYNSYEIFSISQGPQHLDGETALKYIRTRHDVGGDFSRIKRQQQVISALKDKLFVLSPIWNFPTVVNIWNSLKKNTYSNLGLDDIKYAWNLAKKTDFEKIEFYALSNQPGEKTQLLISDNISLSGQTAYILKPKAGIGNYEEIKTYIKQIIKQ